MAEQEEMFETAEVVAAEDGLDSIFKQKDSVISFIKDRYKRSISICYADGNDINSKKLDGFKNLNLAIILGSEQKGVSKLLKKKCDSSISIYGNKKIDSLNVSVATGIILSKFANL